jgi:hypothetical protein
MRSVSEIALPAHTSAVEAEPAAARPGSAAIPTEPPAACQSPSAVGRPGPLTSGSDQAKPTWVVQRAAQHCEALPGTPGERRARWGRAARPQVHGSEAIARVRAVRRDAAETVVTVVQEDFIRDFAASGIQRR